VPKVEEFYHFKKMEYHAAQALALRERNHNFRHFRSSLILAHLLSALFIGLKLNNRV
jgi:hypothetical protein